MTWTATPRRIASRLLRRAGWPMHEGRGAAILMYHRIGDETFDPWGLAVTRDNFRAQVEWLGSSRTVLPLTDLARRHRAADLPPNAIAITFDDAYASTANVALPILADLKIPGTVFVPAELLERRREFWWDELEQLVLTSERTAFELDGQSIPLGARSADDRHWSWNAPPGTPRQKAFHALWSRLRTKTPAALDAGMDKLRDQMFATPAPRETHRPMTADEARSRRSELVEWGSHALTHPSLPSLSSKQKRREIAQSIEKCAELFGSAPRSFAYPYGDRDRESEALVKQAGFICACTTEHRFVTGKESLFALPRMQAGNWDAEGLARLLGDA